MSALRSDAARSRERILDTARSHDVHNLRLNDVARDAGVGVGTVYRHFPNTQSLLEALTLDTIGRLLEVSRDAGAEPDPARAFSHYLRSALTLLLEFDGLQAVMLSPDNESEEMRTAKHEIFETFEGVLERAKTVGAARSDLTLDQVSHLACGIEYAVRLGSPDDRDRFLDVLLAGLRA